MISNNRENNRIIEIKENMLVKLMSILEYKILLNFFTFTLNLD